MKPTFNVREQSEIYIGPTADILSGVLPVGIGDCEVRPMPIADFAALFA